MTSLETAMTKERVLQGMLEQCKLETAAMREELDSKAANVSGSFRPFTIKGTMCDVSTADLPMQLYREARTVDLSYVLEHLFRDTTPGASISERIDEYMTPTKWAQVDAADLFVLPINLEKKKRGYNKCDLPNVTYVMVFKMLKRGTNVVIVDPIHKGTDPTVRICNLSRCLASARAKYADHPTRALPRSDVEDARALNAVFYQRGTGVPDEKTTALIHEAIGSADRTIVQVQLSIGKYIQGQPSTCYSDFAPASARILTQFEVLHQFTAVNDKTSLGCVHVVLDEFPGYAMMTAVAVLAFGLEDVVIPLAYHAPANGKPSYKPI